MDRAIDYGQVAGFDEFDAHFMGEQRVFIVGWIVTAGGENHDRRVGKVGQELERAQQAARVLVHRPDPIRLEQFRKGPLHDLPRFQHIGDAWRAAIVVFEDVEPTVADAH